MHHSPAPLRAACRRAACRRARCAPRMRHACRPHTLYTDVVAGSAARRRCPPGVLGAAAPAAAPATHAHSALGTRHRQAASRSATVRETPPARPGGCAHADPPGPSARTHGTTRTLDALEGVCARRDGGDHFVGGQPRMAPLRPQLRRAFMQLEAQRLGRRAQRGLRWRRRRSDGRGSERERGCGRRPGGKRWRRGGMGRGRRLQGRHRGGHGRRRRRGRHHDSADDVGRRLGRWGRRRRRRFVARGRAARQCTGSAPQRACAPSSGTA